MANNNMGAYHLADYNNLYEPARSNNFEFIVTGIDTLLKAGMDVETATEGDYIRNGQDTIRVSVVSSSVPHFTMSTIDVKRGNSTIHFAGTPTFGEGTLKLNDYIGAKTKDVLLAWQALAYDVRTEKVHFADNYKKTCELVEYSPDYDQVIRRWILKGCWISALSEGDFNNEDNSKREVTATIVYDRAIPAE